MNNNTNISDLIKVVRVIGDALDTQIPLQRALVFLLIVQAGEGNASMKLLADKSGLAPSSVSRHVMALGKLDRNRKPGLDLVATVVDKADWRVKPINLTPKGRAAVKQLQGALS